MVFSQRMPTSPRFASFRDHVIGPTAEVIEMMGEKDRARREVKAAGLPTSGKRRYRGRGRAAWKEAARIGYPLILKAVAGGGGRGMRVVRNQGELLSAYQTARSEAQQAFGNPDVYAERFLEHPRHIEFQVPATSTARLPSGRARMQHQRRHQKLMRNRRLQAWMPRGAKSWA